VEPRVYYDETGFITAYYETNHPTDGTYIVLQDPNEYLGGNSMLMRVENGKLVTDTHAPHPNRNRLTRSTTGQTVVAGHAALALMPTDEYNNIEHYDRKTNN
jgi:hypothetical protein